MPSLRFGFALFPGADLLDVAGPVEVFSALGPSGPEIHLAAANPGPLPLGSLHVQPTCGFGDCPDLDILAVPGGEGTLDAMESPDYLDFLRRQAACAKFVFGVCAGALPLAAAGILDGHCATTHWASISCLGLFPEVVLAAGFPRYVISGNRITTGGVSSGLDGALALVAILYGEQAARSATLAIQYDPDPPYRAGNPTLADPVTLAQVAAMFEPARAARAKAILKNR